MKKIKQYKMPSRVEIDTSLYKKIILELELKIIQDQKTLNTLETDNFLENSINHLKNKYTLEYSKIRDIMNYFTIDSLYGNHQQAEYYGWFVFPGDYSATISGFPEIERNELYAEIYDKYFNNNFFLNILDKMVNDYFLQAIACYKNKAFYSCMCSLFPILEWYQRKFNAKNERKFSAKIFMKKIVADIENRMINFDEEFIKIIQNKYEKIVHFVENNYYTSSHKSQYESIEISRNKLIHGIFTRDINKADCLKLIFIIRTLHYLNYFYESFENFSELNLQIDDLEKKFGKKSRKIIFDKKN